MSDGADGGAGGAGGGVADALTQAQQPGAGGAGADGGAGGAGGDGGDGGAGGGADRWQDKFLPEDMRGDETLALYKDIPSLAKGLVETKRWATGRVALPGADATDEQWGEFVGKMRPEKADVYEIAVPEGQPTDRADAARMKFHEIGLHPRQAKALAEWDNQVQADALSKLAQKNRDELTAMELNLGDAAYNQRLIAVGNMMASLGHENFDAVASLESALGAGTAMSLLFSMAERTGELAKVDGAQVQLQLGNLTPEQASAKLDEMQADPEMRRKYSTPGTSEQRLYKQLIDLQAKGA